MKIYYEDSMPYAAEFLAGLGECRRFNHQSIKAAQLADADILLVRSTTKVDEALLHQNDKLRYVATATAGTDHMDLDYLQTRGLAFGAAEGCNATAVAEYVLSAQLIMSKRFGWQLAGKTVGIVGAGHVGSCLAGKLAALGVNYRLCDPPLQAAGDPRPMVSLDEIMRCDLISLHTPLVADGPYPTLHMFDHARLAALSEQQVLINACRGEVVDNQAALALFEQGKTLNLVLDVWEGEPSINFSLIPHIALATAHIAGHTIEGKARGTEMLYQQLCSLLERPVERSLPDYLPDPGWPVWQLNAREPAMAQIADLVLSVYDIRTDDTLFKQQVDSAEQFIYSRKHYAIRREFAARQVQAGNFPLIEAIYKLGFSAAN